MSVYTGKDDGMVWILAESVYVENCMLKDGHAVSRAEYDLKQDCCFA